MELAGFYISPAERLRVLKVLNNTNLETLKSPQKLKYLLCPVLVQGRAEQDRFYELFDQYWEELQRPWELPEADSSPAIHFPTWLRWLLVGLILGGLTWAAISLLKKGNPPAPKVFFKHEPEVVIGDTVHFENLSENIDSNSLRWEVVDTLTGQTELVDSQSFDLSFVVAKAGENHHREVRLTCLKSIDPSTSKPTVHASSFRILCNNLPVIDTILAVRQVNINEAASFEAKSQDSEAVEFSWDFGDSTSATGKKVSHKFERSGQFEVQLTATRTGLDGHCSIKLSHQISVGREVAYLPEKIMIRDHVDAKVNFSWSTWILMGLLGLAIIWFWVKWATRKPPAKEKDGLSELAAARLRYQAPDKGPYFIPFRPQEGFIRMEPQFYRLADVLRKRQEGLRRNMDVPASVKKTIAEGGFPSLLTRADAVPTEYLFLIDEHSPNSHQSKLYSFLVDFLRKREVLGDVFYFKTEPIRFWNSQFPEGLNPDQLYRFFPHHRLIVLGDGHGLIDPHQPSSAKLPKLRPDAVAFLQHWKHRILLTPVPVVSWNYKESALHRHFALFPSDTDGLAEVLKFVERGMDSEELPTYAMWCERLLEGRRETDLNYRRWRTASDHWDFLKNHPGLYLWVCALAVYPKPEWNITLAIGRALAPKSVELNYNNLLIISRIPWLQTGDLSPRLRQELLNDLDDETERLAREAVKHELQAVEALVQGSHANQEHQINLALQNFAIAPDELASQVSIRELLALNLITPRQLNELNQSVEKHFGKREQQAEMGMNKMAQQSFEMTVPFFEEKKKLDIKAFLEENKAPEEKPDKPFFTKDFWWACGTSLAYLMIFMLVWNMGGSKRLADWALPKEYVKGGCEELDLYAYFLKKACVADSAVLYNNAGVNAYQDFMRTVEDSIQNSEFDKAEAWMSAERNFKLALERRPDYSLAEGNLGRLYFNSGKVLYDAMLRGFDLTVVGPIAPSLVWDMVLPQFRLALPFDHVKADALHALGLVHFYAERRDSAMFYYNAILQETDSLYFSELQAYPNLESLLEKNKPVMLERVTVTVLDAKTNQPLRGVRVVSQNFQGITDTGGKVYLEQLKGTRQQLVFTKQSYASARYTPNLNEIDFTVKMTPQTPPRERDTDQDGVPDSRDKCPKEPGDPKNAGCPLPPREQEIPAQSTPPDEGPAQTVAEGKDNPVQQSLPKQDDNAIVPLEKAFRKPVFQSCSDPSPAVEERCMEKELNEYFKNRIEYPVEALKSSIETTIDVSFIVEKDGSITEVKAVNYVAGGFVEEVLRLVGQLPKFKPGQDERGKPIRVRYTRPITFSLK